MVQKLTVIEENKLLILKWLIMYYEINSNEINSNEKKTFIGHLKWK